jgi:AAA ATPase domain
MARNRQSDVTTPPVCWQRADIQFATQVDVGGLELGDPRADAVFLATHQPVPIGRLTKGGTKESAAVVDEAAVLADFTRELTANEPHLMFVTGEPGTGKSHLVRWLRSSITERPDWHVVYIEKRNTSLRRVIEHILEGIEGPASAALRQRLNEAATKLSSTEEAMLALLSALERLVRFDPSPTVGDLTGAELEEIREKAGRLIGDYNFKERLSRPGGPVERITDLALHGTDPTQDVVSERDLHLSPEDLKIDPEDFQDAAPPVQRLVRTLVSNRAFRRSVATLLDHYLARAKAEVFTGQGTDLIDVFEEVRREVARRRPAQELCLFIEDLVLLHGIDTQLAQALTVPASKDLCRIRCVIAVTVGYLDDVTTFKERGVHYTMDVRRDEVGKSALRTFVGRYLNAGRVGADRLAKNAVSNGSSTPNACDPCPYKTDCHVTFGLSPAGHGLYPFNESSVDRLVNLASPSDFDPRNILREVVRSPLEVAEDELPARSFPSSRFAASLGQARADLGPELREQIRNRSATPEQELSLRAYYSDQPPYVDEGVRLAADYFGVSVSNIDLDDNTLVTSTRKKTGEPPPPQLNEIDRWVNGERLSAAAALKIRQWITETVVSRLQGGPHGFNVRRVRKGSNDWQIGSHELRPADVRIKDAGGQGAVERAVTLRFERSDADALVLKGILEAAGTGSLVGPNAGSWFLDLQARLNRFEAELLTAAGQSVEADTAAALAVLGVCSRITSGAMDQSGGLTPLLRRPLPSGLHPAAAIFAEKTSRTQERALVVLRDRLTQAKGTGAPSVFDAGTVLVQLRGAAGLQRLTEPFSGSEAFVRLLEAFDRSQREAAVAAWRDVGSELERLQSVLSPEEEFAAGADELDRFIDEAHARGLLPENDARDRYREQRRAISDDAMEIYRRLNRRLGEEVGPESLWEVAIDPRPKLRDLRNYTIEAQRLLGFVAAKLAAAGADVGTGDRQELRDDLRTLADQLDRLEKRP